MLEYIFAAGSFSNCAVSTAHILYCLIHFQTLFWQISIFIETLKKSVNNFFVDFNDLKYVSHSDRWADEFFGKELVGCLVA